MLSTVAVFSLFPEVTNRPFVFQYRAVDRLPVVCGIPGGIQRIDSLEYLVQKADCRRRAFAVNQSCQDSKV